MKIVQDSNEIQKRLQGQIAGSRGSGYAEILPNKEIQKFLKKNKVNKKKK